MKCKFSMASIQWVEIRYFVFKVSEENPTISVYFGVWLVGWFGFSFLFLIYLSPLLCYWFRTKFPSKIIANVKLSSLLKEREENMLLLTSQVQCTDTSQFWMTGQVYDVSLLSFMLSDPLSKLYFFPTSWHYISLIGEVYFCDTVEG